MGDNENIVDPLLKKGMSVNDRQMTDTEEDERSAIWRLLSVTKIQPDAC